MSKLNGLGQPCLLQERKHRRFGFQYPVRLKVHSSDLAAEFQAMSRNISIRGLLLETSAMIPRHTPVSFMVTVEGSTPGRPIHFVGKGKVVRADRKAAKQGFAIAVECARPITQINHPIEAPEG